MLYLKANPSPNQPHLWDGQSPPIFKNQKGKPVAPLKDDEGKPLLHFGVQKKQREEKLAKQLKENGAMWKINFHGDQVSNIVSTQNEIKPVPTVKNVIGTSLNQIGPYKKLDNTKQVVALIDDV